MLTLARYVVLGYISIVIVITSVAMAMDVSRRIASFSLLVSQLSQELAAADSSMLITYLLL